MTSGEGTLTNEEIVTLINAGQADLLAILLEQNRGYIHALAQHYYVAAMRNRGCDGDDLVQSATLGMIEAVEKWDERRGAFLTIATLYMKKCIRSMLGMHSSKGLIENERVIVSLDEPVSDELDGEQLVNFIKDEDATCPLEAAVKADTLHIVREAIKELPDDERICIHAQYFGDINAELAGGSYAVRLGCMRAINHLRNNCNIRWLRERYDAAPYHHVPLSIWKYTGTSSVEMAGIRRESLITTKGDVLHSSGIFVDSADTPG